MGNIYSLSTLNESFITLDDVAAPTSKPISTMIESMIEFNEELCVTELYSIQGFYSSMLESTEDVLHEGVFSSIAEFIKKVIATIINFFRDIFGGRGTSKSIEVVVGKTSEKLDEVIDKLKSTDESKRPKGNAKVKVYKYTSGTPKVADIMNPQQYNEFTKICEKNKSIIDNIETVREEDTIRMLKELTEKSKKLNKELNGSNSSSPISVEEQEVDLATFTEERVNILTNVKKNLNEIISNKSYIPEEIKVFITTYKRLQEANSTSEYAATIATELQKLVSMEAALSTTILRQFNAYVIKYSNFFNNDTTQLDNIISSSNESDENNESNETDNTPDSEIEEMTTLLNDRIAIEFADYRYTTYDLIKEGMIKEALIKANPDADVVYEMQLLNEAIGQKVKNAFNKMVDYIKKIIQTFMEKLRANFTTTKHYLDKYKNVILKNKVPDGNYTTKDIINGMYRVVKFEIPAFSYKQIQPQLKSPYDFFGVVKAHCGNIEGQMPEVTNGEQAETLKQIAEFFKVYFGCAGEDKTFTSIVIQEHIKDMYDFMYDIRKIERSINSSIKEVEGMREKALKEVGIPVTQTPTPDGDSTGANSDDARSTQIGNKQEGTYFSYLNNLSTLLELERTPPPTNTGTPQTPQNSTPTNPSMTGKVADNMKNVGKADSYGTQDASKTQLDADCEVYIKVCTKILQAKLTATEYIRTEIMNLFRMMVSEYVEGESVKNPKAAANTDRMTNIAR